MAENFEKLSPRERTIAERFAGGDTYTQIAQALHIAPSTVRNHLASIYRKLEVNSKPALIGALAATRESEERPPDQDVDRNTENVSKGAFGLVDQAPVQYCRSVDGVSIAHAQVGTGYPLVFGGSWMTHLEKDWENPGYGHYMSHLAENFTIVRYDQRGNGMSDWSDVDISFQKMVDDLKCVVDCYQHEKVALFGASQAAAVAIAYACAHPDRVSHLILYGGYPRGRRRRGDPAATAESEALATLIRQGWGRENPAYRQTMTSMFMPEASQEEEAWFNEFQRACGPGENIARFREVFDDINIVHLLEKINCPTLVVHCVGDSVAPLDEGRLLATRIPQAQFVTLSSNSHMIFENDPEFGRFLESIRGFLA